MPARQGASCTCNAADDLRQLHTRSDGAYQAAMHAVGKIVGEVRVNGHPWEVATFARVSGYVEQVCPAASLRGPAAAQGQLQGSSHLLSTRACLAACGAACASHAHDRQLRCVPISLRRADGCAPAVRHGAGGRAVQRPDALPPGGAPRDHGGLHRRGEPPVLMSAGHACRIQCSAPHMHTGSAAEDGSHTAGLGG